MNPYLTLCAILLVGFIVYFFIRDRIFFVEPEPYVPIMDSKPAPAPIELRQAPEYAAQVVAPSGPSAPSSAPPAGEVIHHPPPQAIDPYRETQESSDIPETLRHPERSYRAPPVNDMTALAVQSGVASPANADHSPYQQELIQGGGEFMPGIVAHDSSMDTSYSLF
jgi:hypothetical protein